MNRGGTIEHSSDKHDTSVPKQTNGNFTGTDAINRAVAHSIGRVPKRILICNGNGTIAGIIMGARAYIFGLSGGVTVACTAATSTNFYTGADTTYNAVGSTYYWYAEG